MDPLTLDQALEQLQAIKVQHGGGAPVVVDNGHQHFPLEVTSVSFQQIGVNPARRVVLRDDSRGNEQAVAVKSGDWVAENREALESSNAFVEAHGLPLGRERVRPR